LFRSCARLPISLPTEPKGALTEPRLPLAFEARPGHAPTRLSAASRPSSGERDKIVLTRALQDQKYG